MNHFNQSVASIVKEVDKREQKKKEKKSPAELDVNFDQTKETIQKNLFASSQYRIKFRFD